MQQEVEAIVRRFEDEYAAAFGRKDAKAFSDLLAEDATLLSEWGDVMQGRAKITTPAEKGWMLRPCCNRSRTHQDRAGKHRRKNH